MARHVSGAAYGESIAAPAARARAHSIPLHPPARERAPPPSSGEPRLELRHPLPQRFQLGAQALVLGHELLRARAVVVDLGIGELRLENAHPILALLDVALDALELVRPLLLLGARAAAVSAGGAQAPARGGRGGRGQSLPRGLRSRAGAGGRAGALPRRPCLGMRAPARRTRSRLRAPPRRAGLREHAPVRPARLGRSSARRPRQPRLLVVVVASGVETHA